MADHKIARLRVHSSWCEQSNDWPSDRAIGSTWTSDFAVDLLQVQQREISMPVLIVVSERVAR
jgi:hypothetical protein